MTINSISVFYLMTSLVTLNNDEFASLISPNTSLKNTAKNQSNFYLTAVNTVYTMTVAWLAFVVLLSAPFSKCTKFLCPGLGNFPNPDDCSSFYVCGGSDPVLLECPGDLLFDPTLKLCNNPESVVCSTASTTSTSPATTTVTPQQTSTVSTTPGQQKCPNIGTELVENPDDCTTFFVCINGNMALNECPDGFGFDPVAKDCVPGSQINCKVGTVSSTTPPNVPFECSANGQQLFPNPDDCSSFYICFHGKVDLVTCAIGLGFDVVSGRCEELGGCGGVSTPKTPLVDCSARPNGAVIPDPTDCSKFYQCSNGLPLRSSCAPGLEFNAAASVCDQPDRANCQI